MRTESGKRLKGVVFDYSVLLIPKETVKYWVNCALLSRSLKPSGSNWSYFLLTLGLSSAS